MDDEKLNLTIKNWAEDDRPREKLLQKGKLSLSDSYVYQCAGNPA